MKARELLATLRGLPTEQERVAFAMTLLDSSDRTIRSAMRYATLDDEVAFYVEEWGAYRNGA